MKTSKLRKIVIGVLVSAVVLTIGIWVLIASLTVSVVKNPEVIGEKAAEVANGWDEAREKNYEVVPSDETIDQDSLEKILKEHHGN
jgi:hypothetical protein